MTKKKSIQGMKSLAKVVGLSAVMASTAYATHDDVAAVISDSVGSAAFITSNASGVVTSAPVTSPESISSSSYGIGLGDFDNDGLADYLVGGRGTGGTHIEFVKRTGSGNSFAAGVTVAGVSGSSVADFAVADYDQDGNLDFAYNNHDSRLNDVYLGNGDGTFTLHAELPIPFLSIGMDSDDINNDGNPDFVSLAVVGYDSTKTVIQTHLGDGSGGFSSQTHVLNRAQTISSSYPWGMALTDLNNDGKADLIVSIYGPAYAANNLLEVHLGNGDGTFAQAASITGYFPTSDNNILYNNYAAIDDGDFNHDGNRDIIMALPYYPYQTLVLFGNGDGTLTPSAQGAVPVSTTGNRSLFGISTAPHLTYANSPPVAEAGGPYTGTTDEVSIEVNPATLNLDASGKWVKVKMSTDPDGMALVNLDGSASTDADDDTLTYDWVVTDNANAAKHKPYRNDSLH